MADELSLADARTLYQGCLVWYKGGPAKIARINDDWRVRYRNLDTMEMKEAAFKQQEFGILPRLGFVNSHGACTYLMRTTARRYQQGLTTATLEIRKLPRELYRERYEEAMLQFQNMESLELGRCIRGEYPSLRTALRFVKEFGGAMAFDRQFALAEGNLIYYRDKVVGTLPRGCSTIERIEFDPAYAGLENLIGDRYAKALRVPR